MPDYFTLPELRAMPDMGDADRFPDDRCEAAAAALVSVIELEVGTSFVPRTITETHDGGGAIFLNKPYVLSVTSATVDAVVVAESLIARHGQLLRVDGSSLVAWDVGYGNVSVTYQAGYSTTPPADVKEQALKGTRAHLLATAENSSMNERRTSMSNELGGTTTFVVAGEGRPTGYPDVDAMILRWKRELRGVSVA